MSANLHNDIEVIYLCSNMMIIFNTNCLVKKSLNDLKIKKNLNFNIEIDFLNSTVADQYLNILILC